ncbi:HAD family phosphatase [Porphyromonadaceae bacterium OttesenSCG-928-L07]|nr:HAD family phosphatase [Porphyromonadaceae bacterium OttesenSCG-928-L07]MDL2251498.1 HAD family phosphatase [Odoribacter sp. OttesenSCG-928-J03]MDL2283392.1 HAD family phosphatase [Odoribacter sp. OttesenSCG-928-G04]
MSRIKNVVFDLGGVVIDWSPEKIRREYKENPELAEFVFKNNEVGLCWQDFDRGILSANGLAKCIAEAAGLSEKAGLHFMEYIKNTLGDITKTVDLMKELSEQDYKLYCLSNLSVDFYDYLKNRSFFNYLDGRIISALEGVIKPDPAIYQILLSRYALNPEETLFIDDLAANIATAQTLGFHTVHFADKEKGYQEIAALLND